MKRAAHYPVCHKCRKRRRGRYKFRDVWECQRCGGIAQQAKEWYVNGGIELKKYPDSPGRTGRGRTRKATERQTVRS